MWISLVLAWRSGSRYLTLDCTFETFTESDCWANGGWGLGAISDGGDFTVTLFRDGVWGENYCWNCCSYNFCCRNIFVIVYQCGLLVDKHKLLKYCGFINSYELHWWWWLWKPKSVFFNNNKIKENEEHFLIISKCTLLHNQNDRWTLP